MRLIPSLEAGVDEVNGAGYSRAIIFSFIVPYSRLYINPVCMVHCCDLVDSSTMLAQPFNRNYCEMYFKRTFHDI